MRKIIEQVQDEKIVCDNEKCDYVVPNENPDIVPDLKEYINKPCPKCGENLLTVDDYNDFIKLTKTINWANKWFGWLTFIFPPEKYEYKHVKVHNGVHITDSDEK